MDGCHIQQYDDSEQQEGVFFLNKNARAAGLTPATRANRDQ